MTISVVGDAMRVQWAQMIEAECLKSGRRLPTDTALILMAEVIREQAKENGDDLSSLSLDDLIEMVEELLREDRPFPLPRRH
jgi:hypothetical protein